MAIKLGNDNQKKSWFWWIIGAIIVIVVVIVVLALLGVFGEGKTAAQRLGPDAPANQKPVIAQRNDNSKYQVLLSTFTYSGAGTSGSQVWNQVYYIMYNPATSSSDPTQTVFDTYDAAYAYYNSDYVATPMNKSYSPVSTTLLNADYTNIRGL